jgi:hypothetical protein
MFQATQLQWHCKVVQDQNLVDYEHVYTSEVATFELQKKKGKTFKKTIAVWHKHSANLQSRIAIKE